MDLLSDVLTVAGVRSTLGARIEAGDRWGWWAGDLPGAAFHAVTAGTAWLEVPGTQPLQLMPGDVLLLPTGVHHSLASDRDSLLGPDDPIMSEPTVAEDGVVRIGTGPVRTHILCAHYEHDPAASTQPLTLLPDLVHIRAAGAGGGLADTVGLLARELAQPQLASAVVLNSLVDILLVQLLRAWLATDPDEARDTWLGVLGDPLMLRALTKLHREPGRAWTTQNLASELAVSRATLSRRFLAVAGEAPGSYLTRWRMDLAAIRLRDTDETIEAIAHSVGYTSVYAFSRAFSRERAEAPGRFRAAARMAS